MLFTIPSIGEAFSTAAAKVNAAFTSASRFLTSTYHTQGKLSRLKIGGFGDSMYGFGSLSGWGAFLATAKMLHYNADVMIHTQGPANGGHNYAVGQTTTQHMLDVQLPQILAAYDAGTLPPVMWGSPLQNDDFNAVGAAEAAVQRCITFYTALLSRGIVVVSMGVHPKNGVGEATENGFARHYIERKLAEWSASRPGMIYIPILELLKNGDASEEARSLVQWKGPVNAVGGATNDGTHSSVYGARLIAEQVANVGFRRLAALAVRPTFDARDFDQTRSLYSNFLGTQGRLIGSGGKINGVTSANVPAGLELIYDTTKGITITPALTGNPVRPLSLTPSGTATGDVQWALRFTSSKRLDIAQASVIWGEAWFVNAGNWAGVSVGDGRLGLTGDDIIIPFPGCGSFGAGHVLPDVQNEKVTFNSMYPFALRNQDSRAVRYDLAGAFLQGTTPTGRLDVGFQGIFRTDNTL